MWYPVQARALPSQSRTRPIVSPLDEVKNRYSLLEYQGFTHVPKITNNFLVWVQFKYIFLFFLILYYYYFLLYNIVLVLPYIDMHPPRVYTCSPSWTPLPPPSPHHPSGSSQYTSPKFPVSYIKPGLAIHFLYDIIHVLMPFSQIIPPTTESKRLFYISVSLLLSHIQGCCYYLSKFHIYALVYCIGVLMVSKSEDTFTL